MKMTIEQMLGYVEKFQGMGFSATTDDYSITRDKLTALVLKFGFEYNDSYVSRGVNTWAFSTYILPTDGDNYIYVKIGRSMKKNGKYFGIGEVNREYSMTGAINPETGKKWQIGDIDSSQPLQPMYTAFGWRTGD